ncbi:MBL fold metallo-hydrolase [Roseisolibacter sp. H3M3-2]|uniref:MBL fold metallo-hydrolase n=1 Tax=Roseisolibacter sp. H3M3-2 TaxID=3031323 RepID=UPI0023DCC3D0|nr:MBL fold metallo-hydrolase [Roseisolibacter sp. H3M3-2]MDF1503668.1 MBL fold metallo-hydrolase [Roseisolibacter sp. H3M3-2]
MRLPALAAALLLQPPPPAPVPLGHGAYLVPRAEPPAVLFESNGAFVVGERGVTVVDAQFTAAHTREVLAAVRRVTRLPVRTVVVTHAHDDHVSGLQVWRDSFPDVAIVAHAATRDDLAGDYAARRRQLVADLSAGLGRYRALLAEGRSPAGRPIDDEERASYAAVVALGEGYLADAPAWRPTPPTRTFEGDSLALPADGTPIVLRHLGRGHTAGDIVVHLPAAGIVFAGDLAAWPVPLVGTTSFPAEYAAAVGRLRALGAAVVASSHGSPLRDDARLARVQTLLAAVQARTAAAVARGETLEQARRSVDLSDFRRAFAGESRVRGALFDAYVAGPAVARAHAALTPAR